MTKILKTLKMIILGLKVGDQTKKWSILLTKPLIASLEMSSGLNTRRCDNYFKTFICMNDHEMLKNDSVSK